MRGLVKTSCILTRPLTTRASSAAGKSRLRVPLPGAPTLCLLEMPSKVTKSPDERRRALVSLLAEAVLEAMLKEDNAPPATQRDAAPVEVSA